MSAEAIGRANISVAVNTTETAGAQPPNREVARTHKTEAPVQAPVPEPTEEEVRKSAERVSEAVSRLNRGIRFEIDDSTHTIITKLIDKNTNEVIRQIPSEEVLEIAQRLRQNNGVLLNIEA